MPMLSGGHTVRHRKSHYPSKSSTLHTDTQSKERGFHYYEQPGHHTGLIVLAKKVAAQAALDFGMSAESKYEAGPMLISIHLTDVVEGFVINSLQAQGIGIDEGLKCFVDCFPFWNKALSRSIPHTFVYTVLG